MQDDAFTAHKVNKCDSDRFRQKNYITNIAKFDKKRHLIDTDSMGCYFKFCYICYIRSLNYVIEVNHEIRWFDDPSQPPNLLLCSFCSEECANMFLLRIK